MNMETLQELSVEEGYAVNGGFAMTFVNVVGAITTYITVLSYAEKLGEGIGDGFYDATHED